MRILVFTLQFPPRIGGVETMAYQLSRHMARLGAQVIVVAPVEGPALAFEQDQAFQVSRIPARRAETAWEKLYDKLALSRDLASILRATKPDCILCIHWDPCGYVTHLVLRLTGIRIPYYLLAHGMELLQLPASPTARWLKSKLRDAAFKRARRVIAGSQYTRARAAAEGLDGGNLAVIPYGVEWEDENEGSDWERNTSLPFVLLTISRLVPRKGHEVMLKALSQIVQTRRDVVYQIAGTGPERNRLAQLVAQLGLDRHVEFLGSVTEESKKSLLKHSDVFVLPCSSSATDFEGFGIALLEAMKYAKPVIAGRSGGVPEVIDDGKTGLLVEPNDSEDLASKILHLLEHPDERARIGQAGWRAVRERYRWDLIANKHLEEMGEGVLQSLVKPL